MDVMQRRIYIYIVYFEAIWYDIISSDRSVMVTQKAEALYYK
jgi:hypothetical protein